MLIVHQPLGPDLLASGEAVGQRLRDWVFDDRMAQRPAVLENLIFELLGVLPAKYAFFLSLLRLANGSIAMLRFGTLTAGKFLGLELGFCTNAFRRF
jgi:hypothetical protein